jgi:hypothetical protein
MKASRSKKGVNGKIKRVKINPNPPYATDIFGFTRLQEEAAPRGVPI